MITQHNPTENRPSKELKRLARACLLGRYPVPIAAMLAAWFLPGVLLAPFSAGLTAQWNPSAVIYLLATGIIGLLGQLLTVNVTRIHILLGRKQKTSYQDLLWVFRNRPDRYLLAALLMGTMLMKENIKRRFVLQLPLIRWQALGMYSAGIGFLIPPTACFIFL